MKRFCYFAVMLLLLSVALLFYVKRPDGQAYLNTSAIQSVTEQKLQGLNHEAQALFRRAKVITVDAFAELNSDNPAVTQVYKWQDEQGLWHYADKPSPDHKSILITLDDNDITIMPAISVDEMTEPSSAVTEKHKPKSINVYDPQSVQQLYHDAENVKQLLEQRNKQLEQQ